MCIRVLTTVLLALGLSAQLSLESAADNEALQDREWAEQTLKETYVDDVAYIRKAAGEGDSESQYSLGLMHLEGLGVPQDDVEAVKWLKKAAEQGHSQAQTNLGWMYLEGRGAPQDEQEAVKWTRRAAESGEAKAQGNLGWMYFEGRGVPQDEQEALKWIRKAAEQDDAQALVNLGWMYFEGRGVPQDEQEAVKSYRKAAKQGDANAEYVLGLLHLEGRGVPQDDVEAVKWLKKAAEQGHNDAQYELATISENRTGLKISEQPSYAKMLLTLYSRLTAGALFVWMSIELITFFLALLAVTISLLYYCFKNVFSKYNRTNLESDALSENSVETERKFDNDFTVVDDDRD